MPSPTAIAASSTGCARPIPTPASSPTANRGERKGLREVFDNVADEVRLGELIASGHLVPSRTFVIDVGVQDEFRPVRKTMSDFDMAEEAGIMDRAPVTDEVVRHAGVSAALIHGDLEVERACANAAPVNAMSIGYRRTTAAGTNAAQAKTVVDRENPLPSSLG